MLPYRGYGFLLLLGKREHGMPAEQAPLVRHVQIRQAFSR